MDHITSGQWCGLCKNKTEKKIYNFLTTIFSISLHPKFDWCKNINTKRYFLFDFCIDKFIIELDGRQHFKDIKSWYSKSDDVSSRDVYKMKCALDNGYTIIRLVQEEVRKDTYDWKTTLLKILNKTFDNPEIIYISRDLTIYDNHKDKMNSVEINFEDTKL